MKKMIISIALTLLLGPGAGHLYLRRFLNGFLLILASLVMGGIFVWQVLKTVPGIETLNQNPGQVFQEFAASHSTLVFYYDVVFAAFWSYAIVDTLFKARSISLAEAPAPDRSDAPEE